MTRDELDMWIAIGLLVGGIVLLKLAGWVP
jgi:hypothetical protein